MKKNKIGIIGAGTMGNGIAHVFALFDFKVILVDINESVLEIAKTTIINNMNRQLKKGVIDSNQFQNSINNILTGKPISNSQVDWGYEIPKSKQTTGMYGDNSNALMSKSEREAKFRDDIKKMSEKPDGGLCMWKGCERLGKAPYDSIWNLY